jgi:hypothetical protein
MKLFKSLFITLSIFLKKKKWLTIMLLNTKRNISLKFFMTNMLNIFLKKESLKKFNIRQEKNKLFINQLFLLIPFNNLLFLQELLLNHFWALLILIELNLLLWFIVELFLRFRMLLIEKLPKKRKIFFCF